jgi:peroxiredoxin Q/BCP
MGLKRLLQMLGIISVPLALSVNSAAGEEAVLKIGDSVPPFQANDQNGNLWRSEDHTGKGYLVVYFFPIALTGG